MIEFECIRKNVKAWASEHLNKEFKFREYQLDIISTIIYHILNDKTQTQLVEAPTGSGKSILCIIAAGVLADCYEKTSYILCSDLYLWSQYEAFIIKNNLPYGSLKGQVGNYICNANGLNVRLGACKLDRVSWKSLYSSTSAQKLGFDCAGCCEYVQARQRAMQSKVCLMTYQLWLYQMNVVKSDTGKKEFMPRDVIFCDECHKIPEIVSAFASPTVSPARDFPALCDLWKLVKSNRKDIESTEEYHDLLSAWFENLWIAEDDREIYRAFADYAEQILKLPDLDHLTDLICKSSKSKKLTEQEMHLLREADYVTSLRSYIEDFFTSVENAGVESIAKDNLTSKTGEKSVSLACVQEDQLCAKYLFRNADHAVMMSATIGMKDAFDENIGTKLTKSGESLMLRVPSTFDFSSSPI